MSKSTPMKSMNTVINKVYNNLMNMSPKKLSLAIRSQEKGIGTFLKESGVDLKKLILE